jgi:hypothetical protein
MQLGSSRAREREHHHAVQFYTDDVDLYKTVAAFIAEGLVNGQPAVTIMTREHAANIEKTLRTKFIDIDEARRLGDLVILDAEETLNTFMIGGMPDQRLFRRNIGVVIEQAQRGREKVSVRAYGEMVDVLWKKGQSAAAIRLEVLWNELASDYSFALLCGYSMGNFYKQTAGLNEVCELHTHVAMPNGPTHQTQGSSVTSV